MVDAPPARVRSVRAIEVCALALAVLVVGSGPAQAAEPALVPNAGCRDGRVNGAYELQMSNGRVRVVGAFRDGKRTGTFIFWNEDGARVAVIPYDANVRNGTVALWHVGGKPSREIGRRLEDPIVNGQAHGVHRAWHVNGKPMFEATYEHDQLVRVAAWDTAGRELPEARARRLAIDTHARDEAYLARLERMVAEHEPRCDDSIKAEQPSQHHRG